MKLDDVTFTYHIGRVSVCDSKDIKDFQEYQRSIINALCYSVNSVKGKYIHLKIGKLKNNLYRLKHPDKRVLRRLRRDSKRISKQVQAALDNFSSKKTAQQKEEEHSNNGNL